MRSKIIAIGLLSIFINSYVYAEAPVVDANEVATTTSEFNETHDQEFVQRDDGAAQPSTAKRPAVLLSKIETLEQEIQELRGKLEVQAHDLKLLNDQQQAFYKDIDSRLAKLAGTSPTVSKLAVEQPKKVARAVKPTTTTEALRNVKLTPKDNEASPFDTPTTDSQGDGEHSYNAAYQLIKQKHYSEAISAFEAFLIAYPGSSYQANANYWLGELYLMQGHTEQALQAFTRVVTQYPKSPKAVGAQLKIGFVYYDKGQWQAAREALQKVSSLYPDTPSARLASERLEALDQQGL